MFSTLATLEWHAMVKYIAIRMTVVVCYCYVFTMSANAQTLPAADTTSHGAVTAIPANAVSSLTDTTEKVAADTSAHLSRKTRKKLDKVEKRKAVSSLTDTSEKAAADTSVHLSRKARKKLNKAEKRKADLALLDEEEAAVDRLLAGTDSTGTDSTGKRLAVNKTEITKLEDCEIPFEMAYNIKHMRPNEIDSLKIVFQKIVKEDEEEKIITIRMRFSNDHINGYMTKAPIHHSNRYVVVSMPINVKIEWCCTPDTTHARHCAASFAEMKHLDTTEHCTRWIQSDDGTKMVEQVAAAKDRNDKRFKKRKPFFGRVVEFFQFKKKETYLLIPVDKTFKELLKPPAPNAAGKDNAQGTSNTSEAESVTEENNTETGKPQDTGNLPGADNKPGT